MKNATRSLLLFLAIASAMLLFTFVSRHEAINEHSPIQMRGLLDPGSTTTSTTTSTTSTTSTAKTLDTSSQSTSTSTPATTTSSTSHATTTTLTSASSTTSPSSAQPSITAVPTVTTDSAGQPYTSYITTAASSSSAAATNTGSSSSSDSGGIGTGSIIGLSVAGGVAIIAIVSFFVWKFTRKRFADFDDNEAIKWPELNAHGNDVHALPTNSTGRAGFGPENDSDINLVRAPSPGGAYASSIAASSVPEVYAAQDPYAVPPLPHLNPNQPYRDDPATYGQPAGYYDPYRGPVPNTFSDVMSDGHGESIPMTQMARNRSLGPQMAYDMPGRGSPAPQAAVGYMDGRTGTPKLPPLATHYMDSRVGTPSPASGGPGRVSPNPHGAYGYGP